MAKYNLLRLNNPDTLSKVTKPYFTKSQVSSLYPWPAPVRLRAGANKYYSTALVNKCSIDTDNINYETDIIKHLGSYLAGLIEGDGWFSITKNGKYCKYEFGIELQDRDTQLLYKIKKALGVGTIKLKKNTTSILNSLKVCIQELVRFYAGYRIK